MRCIKRNAAKALSNRLNIFWFSSSTSVTQRVEATAIRYPHVKRGNYNTICEADLRTFEGLLDKTRVVTDCSDLEAFNVDWLKMVRGSSKCLLKPKTTEEVAAVLRYCNERRLAVCPQGGNTGLSGGSVPLFDEIILNTQLMNKICRFDPLSGILECQAGCVLDTIDQYVQQHGFQMPLDLGARGSCQIGGNLSTNAGGIRYYRFGTLHNSVLGAEAVLANGTVIDCMSSLRKDNTGFDLKHLFIGAEGLLGVITKVSIQCPLKSSSSQVAFLGLRSFEDVLKTFQLARQSLGEVLSACEFIDEESIDCVRENLQLESPLQRKFPFYMLLEVGGSDDEHDKEKMERFLEAAMSKDFVEDGVVASQSEQIRKIWSIREGVAYVKDGYEYSYDLSLPLDKFYDPVIKMRERLGNRVIRCTGFGHLGDSNLHLCVTSKEYDPDVLALIEPWVYEWTAKVSGSVSAEHGLGFKKKQFIRYSKSAEAVKLMKILKQTMDPNKILNPYKVLDYEHTE